MQAGASSPTASYLTIIPSYQPTRLLTYSVFFVSISVEEMRWEAWSIDVSVVDSLDMVGLYAESWVDFLCEAGSSRDLLIWRRCGSSNARYGVEDDVVWDFD